MKESKEERIADSYLGQLVERSLLSGDFCGPAEPAASVPFPEAPPPFDMDQTIRIFTSFIADLNGGQLIRVEAGLR